MRRRIPTLALAALTVSLAGIAGASWTSAQEDPDLTICHRTNSNANPYIEATTGPDGQDGGADHLGEHVGPLWNPDLKRQKIEWGDVVPPTDANPNGSQAYQELEAQEEGLGQDFIDAGCSLPQVTPNVGVGAVALDKVTTGGTAPAGSTAFNFTVSCESGDVVPAPSVTVDQAALQIAGGVAIDDFCTVTETASNGATSTTFQVTGANNVTTTATSVTFSVIEDTNALVTVTNAYPDPTTATTAPTTPTTAAQVAGVQVTTTTTAAPAALATTGSPASYWYLVAGAAFLLGGTALYGSSLRRLIHIRR